MPDYNNDQQTVLESIMTTAIRIFNEKEQYLIQNDLSERCMCSRLAIHLTDALQNTNYRDYIVDVEYNRGADGCERGTKRLNDKSITVDIIVHKRGYDCDYGFDNLICIEMKKSTDARGCDSDEDRLHKMTDCAYGFCYKAGFMIVANMKPNICSLNIKKTFFLR